MNASICLTDDVERNAFFRAERLRAYLECENSGTLHYLAAVRVAELELANATNVLVAGMLGEILAERKAAARALDRHEHVEFYHALTEVVTRTVWPVA